MACSCKLPADYIAALPARIIQARQDILLALLPTGVSGGGKDGWWDDHITHTGTDGKTWQHWAGDRWKATATTAEFTRTVDPAARTVTVAFNVEISQTIDPDRQWQNEYAGCTACFPQTDTGTE